jgi:hypothetical protein
MSGRNILYVLKLNIRTYGKNVRFSEESHCKQLALNTLTCLDLKLKQQNMYQTKSADFLRSHGFCFCDERFDESNQQCR